MLSRSWSRASARIVLSAVISACAPVGARAQQPAETLEELRFILAPGSDIRVVEADGRTVEGRFDGVSADALALSVRGGRRLVSRDAIVRIQQRCEDSLGNGARTGFLAGAALGLLAGLALDREVRSGGALIPISMAVYGGIGAGIGVGIDAFVRVPRTVYEASARHASVAIGPIAGRSRKGVALSVAF